MVVYSINQGLGWASSGVEYAQSYRANLLRNIGETFKFIFTEMFQMDSIQQLSQHIGFKDNEVIWLYSYFTDIGIEETTYTLAELEQTFTDQIIKVDNEGDKIRYHFTNDKFATVYFLKHSNNIVHRVEYVSSGKLIRKDYFTASKLFSEYYAPKDDRAYLYQRKFFNKDGRVAYEEIIDGDHSIFKIHNQILCSKEEFIAYFIKSLKLTKSDMMIVDRATTIGQAVFRNVGAGKVGVVIHAEHFSENLTDDKHILWNNFYEYQFSNVDRVDFFICSTDAQNKLLQEHFNHYYNKKANIYTIPVGSLDELKTNDKRNKYALVTASRLAPEKNVDWLVRAVIKAKQVLPQLTFDIYGSGGEGAKISQIINENTASDYITLKGHHNLTEIYQNYEVYLSASTSEGFGLTLMEAVGSGLLMIGLDVRYGNQTFITNGKNGYLIPKETDDENTLVDLLSQAIIKLFTENNIEDLHQHSYAIAKSFLKTEVENKWKQLIQEVTGHA